MTEVQLTDFQGITAQFSLGAPLTMISGANGAGKTRIARALAAVLSDTPIPDVEPGASVVLRNGAGLKAMTWATTRPETRIKGPQEDLPRASAHASGLVNLLPLKGKARAAGFAEVFKTEPTQRELSYAVPAELANELEELWRAIEINGWDAVAGDAEKQARELKGRWNEVTGANWGSKVAGDWEPEGEQFADPYALKRDLAQAEDGLNRAIAALETARQARAELPERVDDVIGHPCPWCEKPIEFKFGRLEKVEQPKRSTKEIKEIRDAISGAGGKVANAQDQVYHHERAVGAAKARIADAENIRAFAKERADTLHGQILQRLEIARICGPAGIRKTKLEEVLVSVNRSLAALAEETGLPLLEIWPDLAASLDGTAYDRLSRAESWLARAIAQIEVARRDGSTMVVLDDLDVPVAPKDRNAVLAAIVDRSWLEPSQQGLSAVVMQAAWDVGDAERTPDVAAHGYGVSYWIDHQHGLRPLAEARG